MWTYFAILVASVVLAFALAPKPPKPRPPELEDVEAPTAEEGKAIPVVFGTVWINGANVIWYGDLRTTPIKKSGGKK